MRSSRFFKLMSCAVGLGLAGCGQTEQGTVFRSPPSSAGSATAGARPDVAAAGVGGAGSGGTTGLVATAGDTAAAGNAMAGVAGGAGSANATPIDSPLTGVAKSKGCGAPFAGQSGAKVTIQTMGVKQPNCAAMLDGKPICGDWSTPRDYYVYLPQPYDPNKAYSLVFEGPGCGGNGTNVVPISNNADNTAIRVGLTPGPSSLGHGTNPGQGCFDDKEGDDSIDWAFYEAVYDALNAQLCFDRNRVFAAGSSNGAWLANELGCKYAGDALRPVRGVLPNSGGLPTDPKYVPTCSAAPLAGMWVHEVTDTAAPFSGAKIAIDRAMSTAHCTSASFDTAELVNFPIGGGKPDDTCKRVVDCDPLYPLVVCPLPGNGRSGHDDVVNPGWSTFIKMFEVAPLLTP